MVVYKGRAMEFDLNDFLVPRNNSERYERRLHSLKEAGKYTQSIEAAVDNSIKNLSKEKPGAFVIYGEPQSGKTELMIALTAKLLDNGHKMIVLLLNDSVQLLSQNLSRFRRSGLDPAPRSFSEILDKSVDVKGTECVVFCKKNAKDLQKLIDKISKIPNKVVIDDEADYATPNAKINQGQRTRINELIDDLLKADGIYIGVTATPARLDLNRTFLNEQESWVDFPVHPDYKGQDFFFPRTVNDLTNLGYRLTLLPDTQELIRHLREALFGYLLNVAHLNLSVNQKETCYSMLVHTSGAKVDHSDDYKQIVEVFAVLRNQAHSKYAQFVKEIWTLASYRFPREERSLVDYVLQKVNRHVVIVMNSDFDKQNQDYETATEPSTLFTIAIGGNIVSRGVTFNSLLSMFFTRDAKHKIQQDTYIQRARMFGVRDYDLRYFELSIPEQLYRDWHRCFVFHRLALDSIRRANGAPVWLGDGRINAVAASSVDRAHLDMDSGLMSFALFDMNESVNTCLLASKSPLLRLSDIRGSLGNSVLPEFLTEFIAAFSPDGEASIAIHPSNSIMGFKDANHAEVSRAKGLIGKTDREEVKYPKAVHHLKVYFNDKKRARFFYRYEGRISFSKMLKQSAA
jgi:hypothetical protein